MISVLWREGSTRFQRLARKGSIWFRACAICMLYDNAVQYLLSAYAQGEHKHIQRWQFKVSMHTQRCRMDII
jgi:hypothetical protein